MVAEQDSLRSALAAAIAAHPEFTPTSLARAIGRDGTYIRDYLKGKKATLGAREITVLEEKLGAELHPKPTSQRPPGANQDGPLQYRPPPTLVSREHTMPLYASAEGSTGNGSLIISTDPIDYVPRPFTLENVEQAYAIMIEGESMDPAYEPGDIAWVNPLLGARKNHDVIVYGSDDAGSEQRALIKRLVSYSDGEWTVKQYNPAETFRLSRESWRICHRVVGKLAKR